MLTLPKSADIAKIISRNLNSDVPGVKYLKWRHIRSNSNEKRYLVEIGEPGKYPETIKSLNSASRLIEQLSQWKLVLCKLNLPIRETNNIV
jgi:hypothetical protein